jgi:Flp pilus assembly CpaE family ATPase
MRDTLRIKSFCKGRAPHVDISIVLNKVDGSHGDGLTVAQFERGVEADVACRIAEDHKNAAAASQSGKPLAELMHKKKLLADYKKLIQTISGGDDDETPKAKKKSLLPVGKAAR